MKKVVEIFERINVNVNIRYCVAKSSDILFLDKIIYRLHLHLISSRM